MLQRTLFWIILLLGALLVAVSRQPVLAAPGAQAPTFTPPPVRVEVSIEQGDVNVRAGPGSEYDRVGQLIPGQTGAILARTANSRWLLIEYIGGPDNQGWVVRDFVRVIGELTNVPIATNIPPTPTRQATRTSEFPSTDVPATEDPNLGRPPTFTPPGPFVRPTLLPATGVASSIGVPPALIILTLFALGTFGLVVSLLRLRR